MALTAAAATRDPGDFTHQTGGLRSTVGGMGLRGSRCVGCMAT